MTRPQSWHDDGDPQVGGLVARAYRTSVDVETASRHLWRLHQAARASSTRGARRSLVSALAAVLLFATAGAAVALSGQAVPGDSLYSVKRGAERLHLLVSFAPESDARLHLRFARSRVAEAEQVAVSRPEAVPALLSEIVELVDRASAVGGEDLSEEVELVRREASTALASLHGPMDADVAESVDEAVQALHAGGVAAGGDALDGDGAPGAAPASTEPADAGQDAAAEEGGEDAEQAPSSVSTSPAPDRATPPPATLRSGEEGDGAGVDDPGEGLRVAGAGDPPDEEPADQRDAGAPGGDSSARPPRPAATADGERVAAESTMPTLERLEGLLPRP